MPLPIGGMLTERPPEPHMGGGAPAGIPIPAFGRATPTLPISHVEMCFPGATAGIPAAMPMGPPFAAPPFEVDFSAPMGALFVADAEAAAGAGFESIVNVAGEMPKALKPLAALTPVSFSADSNAENASVAAFGGDAMVAPPFEPKAPKADDVGAAANASNAGGAGAAAKAPNPEGEEGVTGAELSNEVHPGGEDGTAAGAEEKAEKSVPPEPNPLVVPKPFV